MTGLLPEAPEHPECEYCDKPGDKTQPLRWHKGANPGDKHLAHSACSHVYDGMDELDRPW